MAANTSSAVMQQRYEAWQPVIHIIEVSGRQMARIKCECHMDAVGWLQTKHGWTLFGEARLDGGRVLAGRVKTPCGLAYPCRIFPLRDAEVSPNVPQSVPHSVPQSVPQMSPKVSPGTKGDRRIIEVPFWVKTPYGEMQ